MIICKHKITSQCFHIINKFNYCINCKIKLCEKCINNPIHGPHQILSEKELIKYNINISKYIKILGI